ncbi:MAG: P1 family peptidase [Pseudomonadota bacterium]
MDQPGPQNAITDVAGLRVGQAEDRDLTTGVTVVLPDRPAVAAVDVRGGAPGTRETAALASERTVQTVDAVVLSGGSAFGLDAAGGVMDALRRQGRGIALAGLHVPIVPAAILFDLAVGGPAQWDTPPWFALGHAAVGAADTAIRLGNAGAGLGATAGAVKGGTGTASAATAVGVVGALAIANPIGSVLMPGSRVFWTWWLERRGELGGQTPPKAAPQSDPEPQRLGPNTTLAVVATDARLTRAEAERIAVMAQDGIARAIRPVHAPFDGDTVFVLSTAERPGPKDSRALMQLGSAAADCVARAVMRGVFEADPLPGWPAYRDLGEDGRPEVKTEV